MTSIVSLPVYLAKPTGSDPKGLRESWIVVEQMRSLVVNISLCSADLIRSPNGLKSLVTEPHNVPMIDNHRYRSLLI
jgi:hypothetical protein